MRKITVRWIWVVATGLLLLTADARAEKPPWYDLSEEGAGQDAIVKTIARGVSDDSRKQIIVGDYLYLSRSGPMLEIFDLVSLKTVKAISLSRMPEALVVRGRTLYDNYEHRHIPQSALLSFDSDAQGILSPFDVEGHILALKDVPENKLPVGYEVALDGKFISRAVYGSLQVWENGVVKYYRYDLALGRNAFTHAKVGRRWMAFSDKSLCEVDENLVPIRKVLTVDGDGYILDVAGDDKTIGVLTTSSLQIWRGDGALPLRKELMASGPRGYRTNRIVPFAGGYLAAGKQMIWVHPDGSKPFWRCSPSATLEIKGRPTTPSVELSHRRIIMATEDGSVHIVDASKVLERPLAPPGGAEGGPKPIFPWTQGTP